MGQLVFQATLGGQVNLVGPNTASTFNINVPAIAGTLVTTGDTGTVSSTMLASSLSLTTPNINVATATTINGLTVGKGAGSVATNTAVGASALAANTSGAYNTVSGYQAAYANTTGTQIAVFGHRALYANTTGDYNTVFGANALESNTTGANNTALGFKALDSNTTASGNTAVGYQAGYTNTVGTENTFIGYQAGYTSSAASTGRNTFVGYMAGNVVTTGTDNTFIGRNSGVAMTTGSNNVIIGRYTGNQGSLDIRTASNYIVLSDGDGNPRGIFDSSGNLLVGGRTDLLNTFSGGTVVQGANNNLFVNRRDTTSSASHFLFRNPNGEVGSISTSGSSTTYATSSDYRLKEDIAPMTGALSKVALLKPCTYKWKVDGSDGQGFIAHELAEVEAGCVTGEKDAVDADGNPQYQGIDTSFLVATLTAAIQELKAEFDAYKATHP